MKKRSKGRTSSNVIDAPMSFDQLRATLSDEIQKLRTGDTNASNVNAISNACGKFLGSVKTELELCRFLGRQPQIRGILPERFEAIPKKATKQAGDQSQLRAAS